MPRLGSAANVYNSCLRLLRSRGYELWVEEASAEGDILWHAVKHDFNLIADNPIELLGLSAIFEAVPPVDAESAPSYWWVIEGDDIYNELMQNAVLYRPYDIEDTEIL